jgi:gluconolactonase
MLTLVDPRVVVERLGGGATWSEGPVYLPTEDAVLWSDIPGDRILRWSARDGVDVFRQNVGFTNGRTLDLQQRVVTCSHGHRAVERTEPDGSTTVLVDRWNGVPLNSPNDVVIASDGTIWFTDPPYGIVRPDEGHPGRMEYGGSWVFRFVPETGQVHPVITDREGPNGLAFSPDETLLYVSDTSVTLRTDGQGEHHIHVYNVAEGGRCTEGRVFAEVNPGVPDGIRVDSEGNVWSSSADSVQVFAPDGTRLGAVHVPEVVGNLCFGGPDRASVYIAASTSLYQLRTKGSL